MTREDFNPRPSVRGDVPVGMKDSKIDFDFNPRPSVRGDFYNRHCALH